MIIIDYSIVWFFHDKIEGQRLQTKEVERPKMQLDLKFCFLVPDQFGTLVPNLIGV